MGPLPSRESGCDRSGLESHGPTPARITSAGWRCSARTCSTIAPAAPTNLRCSNCHEQNELTDASVRRVAAAVNGPVRNRDGNVIDKGFNNIGVRPTGDDLGVGGQRCLRPALIHAAGCFPALPPPTFSIDAADVTKGFGVRGRVQGSVAAQRRAHRAVLPQRRRSDAARGGGALQPRRQRVRRSRQLDGTPIEPLGVPALTPDEIDALVAFMEALTDERVLYRRAPFDHPQLFVPNGHLGDGTSLADANGTAWRTI